MSAVMAWHFTSFTMSLMWVSDLYMGQVIHILLVLVSQVKLTLFTQQLLPGKQDYTGQEPSLVHQPLASLV